MKVERRSFRKVELVQFVSDFAGEKGVEVDPLEFLRGFFKIGLLTELTGRVAFSLPFLEAYLLADRLRNQPESAKSYFDPRIDDFDFYTFDLYCERGAHPAVVDNIQSYTEDTLALCESDAPNVFLGRQIIRPYALGTPGTLVNLAKRMGEAAEKMSGESSSTETRAEKQRLIDAREAVRVQVGTRKQEIENEFSDDTKREFERLDCLSRASTLLASMIGSGAERLSKTRKELIATNLLHVSERFVHYWTLNRLKVDFSAIREQMLANESVDSIIEQLELFVDAREEVRNSLALFINDQEVKALSGPLATVLHRVSSSAGVRTLRPILAEIKGDGPIEAVIKASWLMDVKPDDGRKAIKAALQEFHGADLLRLVLANHFMWRVFWHHWQLNSRMIFANAAKLALRPMGLITSKVAEEKMRAGPQR